jgi:hypothetical protein
MHAQFEDQKGGAYHFSRASDLRPQQRVDVLSVPHQSLGWLTTGAGRWATPCSKQTLPGKLPWLVEGGSLAASTRLPAQGASSTYRELVGGPQVGLKPFKDVLDRLNDPFSL